MIFRRIPIADETYNVGFDDHCLVVKSGMGGKKIWLSEKFCEWLKESFDKIDFENQQFKGLEFSGEYNDPNQQ